MVKRTRLKKGTTSSKKSRLKKEKIGTIKALYKFVSEPKLRKKVIKKLKSKENESEYSIVYWSPNRKELIRFRREIENRIHSLYPDVKILWRKPMMGMNDLKVQNATLGELVGIGTLLGTFSIGGFK
jgi:hypothetical protein